MELLVNKVAQHAIEQPDKPAVILKKESLTYRQLYVRIAGIAGMLKSKGLKRGDRIAFTAASRPEMAAVYLAIQLCGCTAVFLDKNGTSENIFRIVEDTGARLLLTDARLTVPDSASCEILSIKSLYNEAEGYENAVTGRAEADGSELAEMIFTSGTTGRPKGVMLTYEAVYNILKNTVNGAHLHEDTIMLIPLPMNHSLALRNLRATLYIGGTIVFQNGFALAKDVENNINNFGCNQMVCVPTSFEVMRNQMRDAFSRVVGRFRSIEFGAGSLSVRQRMDIVKLLPGVEIINTWGSSESGGAIFCYINKVYDDPVKIQSIGRPIDTVEVEILDNDYHIIDSSRDNPGRMAVRGPMIMSGYWNNPEETARALYKDWMVTNDLTYKDGDGYIYMLGRTDDIINTGGEKVSPIEVENIACQYDHVAECACIGAEDRNGILGQIPVLFAVKKDGYDETEFMKFMSSRMEKYKVPQKIILIDALPRNRMQKLDRKALKALILSE